MVNIYLLDNQSKHLVPCHNGGLIRVLLKQGKAKAISRKPFTVQLLYPVRNKYIQDATLGVDSGYKYIGASVSTQQQEIFSAELEQDCGMVERNKERRIYRRTRRNRLRHRAKRFNNRVSTKKEGWIAPSLQRKLDTHLKFIDMLISKMPITKITIEIGLFDVHLLKATMEGKILVGEDYQHGEMESFENVKSYVRYRDNYT